MGYQYSKYIKCRNKYKKKQKFDLTITFTEIDRTSKKSEEMLRRTQADKEELEVALDKLRLDLTRAEQHKKELQHQVGYCLSNEFQHLVD